MGLKDWLKGPKFVAAAGTLFLKNETVRQGFKKYPVAGAVAEFQHGANIGGRVTLTRVLLTGPLALGLKKDRNKVYVLVEFPDGEQIMEEMKAKDEARARTFVSKVNQASRFYANQDPDKLVE